MVVPTTVVLMMLLLVPQSEKLAFAITSAKKTLFLETTSGRNPPMPASLGVPAAWVCAWTPTRGFTMSFRLMLITPRWAAVPSVTSSGLALTEGNDAIEKTALPSAIRVSRRPLDTISSPNAVARSYCSLSLRASQQGQFPNCQALVNDTTNAARSGRVI